MNFDDKAWVILAHNEANCTDQCRVAFDHARCNYGQPVLLLLRGRPDFGLVADECIGPGDIKGGYVSHVGPHREALAQAGLCLVPADKNLEDVLGPPLDPAYLTNGLGLSPAE